VVDLETQRVGKVTHGLIRTTTWTDSRHYPNAGFYSPLDSSIPVMYGNRQTTLADLPPEVKARVRDGVCAAAREWIGKDYGPYAVFANPATLSRSHHCVDWALDLYDRALREQGVQVLSRRLATSEPLGPGRLRDYAEWGYAQTNPFLLAHRLTRVQPPDRSAGGSPTPTGPAGLAGAVQDAAARAQQLGGVDFTEASFEYMASVQRGGNRAFLWVMSGSTQPAPAGSTELGPRQVGAAFMVALRLSPTRFWVNLNPEEPRRVIDPQLAQTDVGRAMLVADLQLKRDIARIVHPNTATGKRYWARLEELQAAGGAGGAGRLAGAARVWIIPGEVVYEANGSEVRLARAELDVCVEAQHFGGAPRAGGTEGFERVDEEIVLPELRKRVNGAPEYADLRQCYRALCLARWWRARAQLLPTALSQAVEADDVPPDLRAAPWSPQALFEAYVASLKQGEFDVTRSDTEHRGLVAVHRRQRFFFGGVDFTGGLQASRQQPLATLSTDPIIGALGDDRGSVADERRYFAGALGPIARRERAVRLGGLLLAVGAMACLGGLLGLARRRR
jgi:hypothetical protein